MNFQQLGVCLRFCRAYAGEWSLLDPLTPQGNNCSHILALSCLQSVCQVSFYSVGSTKNETYSSKDPFFVQAFLLNFWPSLAVSVRYHFPAQAHGIQSRSYSKTCFNTDCFSYDFWVSVCLELSVWDCLFGVLTDTLDSKSSISRNLCPRCLFGSGLFVCLCPSVGLCLLDCVFLHRLG